MKKLAMIAALALLMGCDIDKTQEQLLMEMKKPVIVYSIAPRDKDAGFHGGYGGITLKDNEGVLHTFEGTYCLGAGLMNKYKVGDTIK